jgi:hypothetical protein
MTSLKAIISAVKSKSPVTIETDAGSFTGKPRISWERREVVLTSESLNKTVIGFDDIQGF